MRDEVIDKGFEIVFALIIFAMALATAFFTWQTNRSFNRWVGEEIAEKQLVVESDNYNYALHTLTTGEVIEELKTVGDVDIYINGSLVSSSLIKSAKNNPELFTHSPFSFPNVASALYDKEYGYDSDGNISEIKYTLH